MYSLDVRVITKDGGEKEKRLDLLTAGSGEKSGC